MSNLDEIIRLQLLPAILQHLPDAILLVDRQDEIRYWNHSAESLFGLATDGLDRKNQFSEDAAIKSAVVTTEGDSDSLPIDDEQWQQSIVVIQKPGGEHQTVVRMRKRILLEGQPWSLVVFKNPAIEHLAELELSRLALTDPLSELLNRRGFQACLESSLNRRLALAIIDVDYFKRINDQLGHEAGDHAIQWVAERLQSDFPEAICIGRLGGDEFAVVLEAGSTDDLRASFEQFRAEFQSKPISWYAAGMTISIGVAIAKQEGGSARELLTNADRAMYRSKQAGRNQVTVVEID